MYISSNTHAYHCWGWWSSCYVCALLLQGSLSLVDAVQQLLQRLCKLVVSLLMTGVAD